MNKQRNIIYIPKEHWETLKKFYTNFDSMKEFMQLALTADEYDCWLYQNKCIKDKYFGDKPIYTLRSRQHSSKITFIDDINNENYQAKEKDIKAYMDAIKERINKKG